MYCTCFSAASSPICQLSHINSKISQLEKTNNVAVIRNYSAKEKEKLEIWQILIHTEFGSLSDLIENHSSSSLFNGELLSHYIDEQKDSKRLSKCSTSKKM